MNTSVLHRIDGATWIAMACVVVGWFWLNTLVATFGPIQQVAHFYDLPAAMKDPRWLLRGMSESHSIGTVVFGFVCLIVIAAPVMPRLGYPHVPWLLTSAPLLLMLLCGIVLYIQASSAHIEAAESMGRIGGYLARWANNATSWSSDVIGHHIVMGAGAYVSFIASSVLAVKGAIDFRAAAAVANDPTDSARPKS